MLEYIQSHYSLIFHGIGDIVTISGILVVLIGFLTAMKSFFHMRFRMKPIDNFFEEANQIRAILGTYILFGLEFMIAADIIYTFVKPEQGGLYQLACVVIIRTLISFFLAKEVAEARQEQQNKRK